MSEKYINDLIEQSVSQLPISLELGFGTLKDFELTIASENYGLPLMWILPHNQSASSIQSSNVMIDSHAISGILLTDDDVDQTAQSRRENAEFADSFIDTFVSKLNESDKITINSISKSPIYRVHNSISQGKAFVINLTMPKQTQCC
jgi:hypothetical protein